MILVLLLLTTASTTNINNINIVLAIISQCIHYLTVHNKKKNKIRM